MSRPGIDVPRRLGSAYGVAESRHRLRRLAYLEERLATAFAGWIWATPGFDDKIRLAVLAYESSLAADALHARSAELAPSTAERQWELDLADLEELANAVENEPALDARLSGAVALLTRLRDAYAEHLAATDDLTRRAHLARPPRARPADRRSHRAVRRGRPPARDPRHLAARALPGGRARRATAASTSRPGRATASTTWARRRTRSCGTCSTRTPTASSRRSRCSGARSPTRASCRGRCAATSFASSGTRRATPRRAGAAWTSSAGRPTRCRRRRR